MTELKMIGLCNCLITGVRLHPTVRLQLCRLINAKYSSLCTSHIWGNCNGYDYNNNNNNNNNNSSGRNFFFFFL